MMAKINQKMMHTVNTLKMLEIEITFLQLRNESHFMIKSEEEKKAKEKVRKVFTWGALRPERSPPPSYPPSSPSPWQQNLIINISAAIHNTISLSPPSFDQQGSTRSPEGPEGSQCSHRFEDWDISRTWENTIMTRVMMMMAKVVMLMLWRMVTKETGSEVNERDANNDKVEPAPEHSNIEYFEQYWYNHSNIYQI